VKAALQDKQKLTQVTKGKTHQKGSKRWLFNKAARDSKKKQIVRNIQKDCSDEKAWETFKEFSGGTMGSLYPVSNVGS
jgi:hypothetical protein